MRQKGMGLLIVVTLALAILWLSVEASALPFRGGSTDSEGAPSDSEIVALAPPRLMFELSRVSENVVHEFQKAWGISANGTNGKEGVVLVFRTLGGGYIGRVQRKTNEQRKATFTWATNAIAVVHTHPNRSDPRPSIEDMELADKYNVPMFTITASGMYGYDPRTKKTSLVLPGLEWLDAKRWDSVASNTVF